MAPRISTAARILAYGRDAVSLSMDGYGSTAQLHLLTEPDHVLRCQDASDITFINMYLVWL
jgi:hypothetical protein